MKNLDELLQSINDAVWQMHVPTKTFIYINQRLADICEIPLDYIKKNPDAYNDLIHPEDKERVLDEFRTVQQHNSIETEYRIITRSGVKWIRHKEFLLCDSEDKYEVLVGIFSDITQRKTVELQVAESEETYRYLFINNPNPLWIYEIETLQFLAVNDAAIQKYGYSEQEFLTMTIADIRPPEDVDRLKSTIKTITSGFYNQGYWRHIKKDGSILKVNVSSHSIVYANRRASIVLVTDVTEFINAQEELTKSRNNLDALINNTQDLIYSIDTQYRLISANNAFKEHVFIFSGIALDEGDTVLDNRMDAGLIFKCKNYYDRCLQGESYSIIEETNCESFHSITNVSFNSMYNEHGEITGVSCFIHDINNHINNERRIIAQNRRLQEIASLASHDIRGHVTSILGLLDLFDKQNFSNPENAELLSYIEEATQRLDAVIHKIVHKTNAADRDAKVYVQQNQ